MSTPLVPDAPDIPEAVWEDPAMGSPSFPRAAMRFWPGVALGAVVVFVAGVVWSAVALTSTPEIIGTAGPGESIALPSSREAGTAVYIAPTTASVPSLRCRIGSVTLFGDVLPPMWPSRLRVEGLEMVKVASIPPAVRGRSISCTGDAVTVVAVARDTRRVALTYAIPLLVGSIPMAAVALFFRAFTRGRRPDAR